MGQRVLVLGGSTGLGDLTLHQAGEGPGLQADEVDAQFGHCQGGAGEEVVADHDGHGVAPAQVGRGGTAALGGLVHDVVVVEGGDVGQLHDDGSTNQIRIVDLVTELGAQHHQQWTESLAAGASVTKGVSAPAWRPSSSSMRASLAVTRSVNSLLALYDTVLLFRPGVCSVLVRPSSLRDTTVFHITG